MCEENMHRWWEIEACSENSSYCGEDWWGKWQGRKVRLETRDVNFKRVSLNSNENGKRLKFCEQREILRTEEKNINLVTWVTTGGGRGRGGISEAFVRLLKTFRDNNLKFPQEYYDNSRTNHQNDSLSGSKRNRFSNLEFICLTNRGKESTFLSWSHLYRDRTPRFPLGYYRLSSLSKNIKLAIPMEGKGKKWPMYILLHKDGICIKKCLIAMREIKEEIHTSKGVILVFFSGFKIMWKTKTMEKYWHVVMYHGLLSVRLLF